MKTHVKESADELQGRLNEVMALIPAEDAAGDAIAGAITTMTGMRDALAGQVATYRDERQAGLLKMPAERLLEIDRQISIATITIDYADAVLPQLQARLENRRRVETAQKLIDQSRDLRARRGALAATFDVRYPALSAELINMLEAAKALARETKAFNQAVAAAVAPVADEGGTVLPEPISRDDAINPVYAAMTCLPRAGLAPEEKFGLPRQTPMGLKGDDMVFRELLEDAEAHAQRLGFYAHSLQQEISDARAEAARQPALRRVGGFGGRG